MIKNKRFISLSKTPMAYGVKACGRGAEVLGDEIMD
jgi:hypothetical protein